MATMTFDHVSKKLFKSSIQDYIQVLCVHIKETYAEAMGFSGSVNIPSDLYEGSVIRSYYENSAQCPIPIGGSDVLDVTPYYARIERKDYSTTKFFFADNDSNAFSGYDSPSTNHLLFFVVTSDEKAKIYVNTIYPSEIEHGSGLEPCTNTRYGYLVGGNLSEPTTPIEVYNFNNDHDYMDRCTEIYGIGRNPDTPSTPVSIPVQWRSTRYGKTYQDSFEINVHK